MTKKLNVLKNSMIATKMNVQNQLLNIHFFQNLQIYDFQFFDIDQNIEIFYNTIENEFITINISFEFNMQFFTKSSMKTWKHDNSKYVFHVRISQTQSFSNFMMIMKLWYINANVSKVDYIVLKNVFRMLKSNIQFSFLSKTLIILKRQIKNQLSFLFMRKNNISLNSIKLSTHFNKLRKFDFTISFNVFIENFYFFDFSFLFQIFFSIFNIRERLHVKLTKFHKNFSKY